MAASEIPVDLTNPGQVFACLGFMEAAEILQGDAMAGFAWEGEAGEARFHLETAGEEPPIQRVLRFLLEAEVVTLAPRGSRNSTDARSVPTVFVEGDVFPFPDPSSPSTLPVRLRDSAGDEIPIEHWGDNTRRETFKTFAGQQIGGKIAAGLLNGDGKVAAGNGVKNLIAAQPEATNLDPFAQTLPTGGAFVFDSRGATEALEIGTSLDVQSALTNLSPLVDLLAAVGLQNARPRADGSYAMYYSVWGEIMTPDLCRVALAHSGTLVPPEKCRMFRASLGSDKYYKKVFFATEEAKE